MSKRVLVEYLDRDGRQQGRLVEPRRIDWMYDGREDRCQWIMEAYDVEADQTIGIVMGDILAFNDPASLADAEKRP